MSELYERLDGKKTKDVRVLADFVAIFCRQNHRQEPKAVFSVTNEALRRAIGDKELMLCDDCRRLLHHGVAKLLQCPYDPKPMCKKCLTHCYAAGHRERMRKVMRFSGLYLVKRGRLDLMVHYLL